MKAQRASSTPAPEEGFRHRLQGELAARCARNPHYSLRAFALDLEVDHSSLSQLLRGRRVLTERTIRQLAERLGLGAAEVDGYVAHERRWGDSGQARRELRRLSRDVAELISDWYHFALLELVHLADFRPDSGWIARVLGLTVDEVNVAVARLCRLGLLELDGERWLDRSGATLATLEGFTESALERFTAQLRALRLRALSSVPAELREHASATFALDTRRLPELLELLARFRRELDELVEQDRTYDQVYRLEIDLFPLTRSMHPGPLGHPQED